LLVPLDRSIEATEVIEGIENVINRALQQHYVTKERLYQCNDDTGPAVIITNEPVRRSYIELKKRGVSLRFVTEITRDNLYYAKQMMEIVEIRHLDGIRGNFAVTETHYAGVAKVHESNEKEETTEGKTAVQQRPYVTQLIISNVKAFVEQQQYFFDMLWNKAITGKQRIKEIEQDTKRQFIDTIQDGVEIDDLVHQLVKSATEEILLMFPTTNTFYRYENEYLLKSIKEAATLSGIKVRIMVILDSQRIRDTISQDYAQFEQIKILTLRNPKLQSKVITLIIDNEYSLVIELKDDRASKSADAAGLATYSNSESTVSTYISIFETLWVQGELQNI
jgi:hypothetical protein